MNKNTIAIIDFGLHTQLIVKGSKNLLYNYHTILKIMLI